MIRGTARDLLRGRLQERTEDYFSDTLLNTFLNQAYGNMLLKVLPLDAQALVYIYTLDIVADEEYYPWPEGRLYEVYMEIKPAGSDSYREVTRKKFTDTRKSNADTESGDVAGDPTVYEYSVWGDYFTISPVPDLDSADGLRVHIVPWPSLEDDEQTFRLAYSMHMAIVYDAEQLALGETGEDPRPARLDRDDAIAAAYAAYKDSGGASKQWTPKG